MDSLGLGVGLIGSSGDALAADAKVIGVSALGTKFWTGIGEGISRYSTWASIFLDTGQAIATIGTMESWNHGVDAFFDYGISRLGPLGGAIGILWTAGGGMAGAAQNPALNQDLEFGPLGDW
jgi:hypothetical protein